MNFETIAKVGEARIMAKYKNNYYILSFSDHGEKVSKIESPASIFRQGYWEPYEEKDEAVKDKYIKIIEKAGAL